MLLAKCLLHRRFLCGTFALTIMKRLIISTDGLNRYKFRVLSSGGKFEKYLKNPVLLFGHDWSKAPIGRLEDIKVEGDNITAIPVFDEDDELGLACKHKYEKGFLFAASIYFDPLTTSSDPALTLPGQIGETVTEWELLEVSMVTIPGNSEAAIGLSYSRSSREITPLTQKTVLMDYSKIAQALGLDAASITDDLVVLAIQNLKNQITALGASRIDALIAVGKQAGTVTTENEETYRTLAAADFDATSALFAQKVVAPAPAPAQPAQTIVGMLSAGTPGGANPPANPADDRSSWTFDDWSKKDYKGLSALRKTDPAKYQALAQAKYDSVV